MPKLPEVRCPLCGGGCWFDSRDECKVVGALTAWLGLFALPIGCMLLLGWLTRLDEGVGVLVGLVVWAVLTILFFTRQPRWVCKQCGAYLPALRTGAAPDAHRPQDRQDNAADQDPG